jgi:hypothetical protein
MNGAPLNLIVQNWLWVVAGLAVLAILTPVLIGPIVVRRKLQQPARPVLEPIDPANGDLPGPVERFFEYVARALSSEGFEVLGYFYVGRQVVNVKALIAYLEKPTTQEGALAAVIYLKIGEKLYQITANRVEFFTRFLDDVSVATNNGRVIGIFGRVPGRTFVQFVGEDDLSRLYRLHRAMVDRFGSNSRPLVRGNADVAEYLCGTMVRELDDQVQTGYYFRDVEADLYCPTWKGAILMTWKLLWPISWIRRARVHLRAARLRREAEAQLSALDADIG